MNRTICLITALFTVTLGQQRKALAQGLGDLAQGHWDLAQRHLITNPSAPKGTRSNPYSVQELMALTPPPAQAWVYGQIKTVEASIASDPLDIDVTFSNKFRVRVNCAKFIGSTYDFSNGARQAVSVADGVEIVHSSKPGRYTFSLKNTGQILVGLNIKGRSATGIVGSYLPPGNSMNSNNGPLGIPK